MAIHSLTQLLLPDPEGSGKPHAYLGHLGAYVESLRGASDALSLAARVAEIVGCFRSKWEGASTIRTRLDDAVVTLAWPLLISDVATLYEDYCDPSHGVVRRVKRLALDGINCLGTASQVGLLAESWKLIALSQKQLRVFNVISYTTALFIDGFDVISHLVAANQGDLSLEKQRLAYLKAVKSAASVACTLLSLCSTASSAPKWLPASIMVLNTGHLGAKFFVDFYKWTRVDGASA
jgi:hypothetical protein